MCNAEKRLKLIEEDVKLFKAVLNKYNISLKGLKTDGGTEAEVLLNNIEIATDMNDGEADTWLPYSNG